MATFITATELKNHLEFSGSGRDTRLGVVVSGLNAWLTKWLRRPFVQTERTETYRGTGTKALILKHYPVVSIADLSYDGEDIDHTDDDEVVLEGDPGILWRTYGIWNPTVRELYSITYTAGLDGVPDDLKWAVLELGAFAEKTKGGRLQTQGIIRESLFEGSLMELPLVRDVLWEYRDKREGLIG